MQYYRLDSKIALTVANHLELNKIISAIEFNYIFPSAYAPLSKCWAHIPVEEWAIMLPRHHARSRLDLEDFD